MLKRRKKKGERKVRAKRDDEGSTLGLRRGQKRVNKKESSPGESHIVLTKQRLGGVEEKKKPSTWRSKPSLSLTGVRGNDEQEKS